MSDKVKMFLYIAACVIIYVVLIPFQSYRLGYGKGYESGLDAGASIGYGIAIDTITDILDTEITKFSPKKDSITPNIK